MFWVIRTYWSFKVTVYSFLIILSSFLIANSLGIGSLMHYVLYIFLLSIIFSPILFIDNIYRIIKKRSKTKSRTVVISNRKWLNDNYDMVSNMYKGYYVAIYNNRVFDYDKNLKALRDKLQPQIENINDSYISYIK